MLGNKTANIILLVVGIGLLIALYWPMLLGLVITLDLGASKWRVLPREPS